MFMFKRNLHSHYSLTVLVTAVTVILVVVIYLRVSIIDYIPLGICCYIPLGICCYPIPLGIRCCPAIGFGIRFWHSQVYVVIRQHTIGIDMLSHGGSVAYSVLLVCLRISIRFCRVKTSWVFIDLHNYIQYSVIQ